MPDGRLLVADTFNHRLLVLGPDGSPRAAIDERFDFLQRVVIDARGRVFALDSGARRVVAYLDPRGPARFDFTLRDNVADDGREPLANDDPLASPDLLVRRAPLTPQELADSDLTGRATQPPVAGRAAYVYVHVHNRGSAAGTPQAVTVRAIGSANEDLEPLPWQGDALALAAPDVPPGESRLVGPFVLRATGAGETTLVAQVIDAFDPLTPPLGLPHSMTHVEQLVRASNNLALRRLTIAAAPDALGPQTLTVVPVTFADAPAPYDPTALDQRLVELDAWLQVVSAGVTSLVPDRVAPMALSRPWSDFDGPNADPLIELATAVLERLPPDRIAGHVLIQLPVSAVGDRATTGPFVYQLATGAKSVAVAVVGADEPLARYAHAYLHLLGLADLDVIDPGARLPDAILPAAVLPIGWDPMAGLGAPQPLIWAKARLGWLDAIGTSVAYVHRPRSANELHFPEGYEIRKTVELTRSSALVAGTWAGLIIGLTPNVEHLADERHFFWLEARAKTTNDDVPADGALLYYVNPRAPVGHGPVRLYDRDATTPTGDALRPGDHVAVASRGVVVDVAAASDPERLRVSGGYDAFLATAFDLYFEPAEPAWESPDIRVVSPTGNPYEPVADDDNWIVARVHNAGPADARDVPVAFYLSEPYHTLGGEPDFTFHGERWIADLPAGESREVSIPWRPARGEDAHRCIRAVIEPPPDDDYAGDDMAQRNVHVVESASSSPYDPVTFRFTVTNDGTVSALHHFRPEGIPAGWTWRMMPPNALLAPGQRVSGTLKMQPPLSEPPCVTHHVEVVAWRRAGDTLVRAGGSRVDVDLKKRTKLTLDVGLGKCGAMKVPGKEQGRAWRSSHAAAPRRRAPTARSSFVSRAPTRTPTTCARRSMPRAASRSPHPSRATSTGP